MSMRFPLLLLVSLVMFPMTASAQTKSIKFNLVNGVNGIALGKINCIMQDRDGAMWFSDQTNRCITRYDGNSMTRYQNNTKDTNSLGGPYPECIAVDSNGILWIGFWGYGMDRFDPATNTFTHYRFDAKNPNGLANDTVSNILIDHLNNVWIGTNQGLQLLDRATGTFKLFKHNPEDPKSLSYNFVRALYEDHQGTIWVGTGFIWESNDRGGLNKLDRNSGTFDRYLFDPNDEYSLSNNKVRAIFEDSRGTLWIGTGRNGLHVLDKNTGRIIRYLNTPKGTDQLNIASAKVREDHITFITEDAEKYLWIGTLSDGVYRYNPTSKITSHFSSPESVELGYIDHTSWATYAAKNAWLWISTQESNLYKVDIYKTTVDHDGTSIYTSCSFLDQEKGVQYFGGWEGLRRKDLKTGVVTWFKNEPTNPASLSNSSVSRIYKAPDGRLWFATDVGLNLFNEKTQTFTRYVMNQDDTTSLAWNWVSDMYTDSQSNFWVGTYGGGLHLMDQKKGTFKRFQHHEADTTSLSGNVVTSILEGDDHNLWISTWEKSGVNSLDFATKKCKRYLSGNSIVAIRKDSKGELWVGTENSLYKYDKSNDAFVEFTIAGMPVSFTGVTAFIIDDRDHLWFFSTTGVIQIQPETGQFVVFGKESGFLAQSYPYASATFQSNGSITVGSFEGCYSFDPDLMTLPKGSPNIVLTGLQINGLPVVQGIGNILSGAINDAKEIHLAYDQNVFSLAFNAIDFSPAEAKLYFAKLEPYDQDWKPIDPSNPLYYFNVPPGTYTLLINAFNTRYGTHVQKKITIYISQPWWKSWWAYLLYAIGILTMAYMVHRSLRAQVIRQERERNRAHELAQAKEIEKAYHDLKNTQAQLIQAEKMASLGELTAGIAHEIQNPLNFINNFSEVSSELLQEMSEELDMGNKQEAIKLSNDVRQNLEKIIYHGKRADGIVKGMLQHSRASSGVKEPTDINLLADEYLRLAYHGLRAKDKTFNATIKTDFDPELGMVNVIPQDIGRVLLNLITNAFHAVSTPKSQNSSAPVSSKGDLLNDPTIIVSTRLIKSPRLLSGVEVLGDLGAKQDLGAKTAEICVSDNGPGIPDALKEKIFQPFFTTKPTGQGTGLGLSLSYDIIKAHGGEIHVESTEGKGTTFIIHLPVQ